MMALLPIKIKIQLQIGHTLLQFITFSALLSITNLEYNVVISLFPIILGQIVRTICRALLASYGDHLLICPFVELTTPVGTAGICCSS